VTFISTICLALALTAIGNWLLCKALVDWRASPVTLRLGAAYFTGAALHIILLALYLNIFAANGLGRAGWESIFLLLAASCILLSDSVRLRGIAQKSSAFILSKDGLAAAALAAIATLVLLALLLPAGTASGPFAMIGSLHSPRYASIAEFVARCDYLPRLGQNVGQSLLAFSSMAISGREQPYVALFAWLLVSLTAFAMFIHGLISLYVISPQRRILGTFIVMLGNTALSLVHVLVIDSGSPPILSGYSDPLTGTAVAILLLIFQSQWRKGTVTLWIGPISAGMIAACCLSAPQTIVVAGAWIAAAGGVSFLKRWKIPSAVVTSGVALALGLLIGVPQGGMLAPKAWTSGVQLPGIMTVQNADVAGDKRGVAIKPYLPFHVGDTDRWIMDKSLFNARERVKQNGGPTALWFTEQLLMTALRVLFFPALGIAALYWVREAAPERIVPGDDLVLPSLNLANAASIALGVGFLLAFSIELNGYKWELVRFLIPGIILGMLCFAVSFCALLERPQTSANFVAAVKVLLAIMFAGPSINIILTASQSIQTLSVETLASRWKAFVGKPSLDAGICHTPRAAGADISIPDHA